MKVELIDNMGNDLSVIRAATASFAKDPVEWDEKKHPRLINYLARGMAQVEFKELVESLEHIPSHINGWKAREKFVENALEQYRHTPTHWSPFAHTTITLRLKAPIAIHAQMMKHTVGFAHNTVSRRYVSDTPELFVPTFRHAPDGNVKQGSGDVISEIQTANRRQIFKKQTVSQAELQAKYDRVCSSMIKYYNELIEMGVSPEQARFILPQGVMTEWVSTGSLYAWARFYNQRTDPHAQKEIQDLAKMVGDIIEPLYPHSWKALVRS